MPAPSFFLIPHLKIIVGAPVGRDLEGVKKVLTATGRTGRTGRTPDAPDRFRVVAVDCFGCYVVDSAGANAREPPPGRWESALLLNRVPCRIKEAGDPCDQLMRGASAGRTGVWGGYLPQGLMSGSWGRSLPRPAIRPRLARVRMAAVILPMSAALGRLAGLIGLMMRY